MLDTMRSGLGRSVSILYWRCPRESGVKFIDVDVEVFQFSIGDAHRWYEDRRRRVLRHVSILYWRCPHCEKGNDGGWRRLFQFSIGDAVVGKYYRSFYYFRLFQFSIGDAIRERMTNVDGKYYVSILYWRCSTFTSWRALIVTVNVFQFSIGDADRSSPRY